MTRPRQGAVLLFGGLVAAWNPAFLKAARVRGLASLVVDRPSPGGEAMVAAGRESPAHPLAGVADVLWAAPEAADLVLAHLRRWAARYRPRGVVCFHDAYLQVAGQVADLLGLPSPGLRASRACHSKYLQRLLLGDWSPSFRAVTPRRRREAVAAQEVFPIVVKPDARQSSSGVQLVTDRVRLARAMAEDYGDGEQVLFEWPVRGAEYSVESLVQRGLAVFAGITAKRTNEVRTEYFVEMGHTVPAFDLDERARERLLAVNAAVLERLAFRDGMAHAEYRVTPQGDVRLMEVAARPAGDSILMLHDLASGRSIEEAVVALAIGEPVSFPAPRRYARQVYVPNPPGRLEDVTFTGEELGAGLHWLADDGVRLNLPPSRAEDPPTLRSILVLKARGELLRPERSSADRSLTFIVDAPTVEGLDALEREVLSRLRVRVSPA